MMPEPVVCHCYHCKLVHDDDSVTTQRADRTKEAESSA